MGQAWKLILFLLSHHAIGSKDALLLYTNSVEVVSSVSSEDAAQLSGGRLTYLLLVIEWAARESAGQKNAVGKAGDCGRLQLVFEGARDGHTCKEIAEDELLDLRLGLRWMRYTIDYCGGLEQGLSAYATGSCTSPSGLKIARMRLAEIKKGISE